MSRDYIQVVAIEKRCEVGTCVSRPFMVRAEDGQIYWLKGLGTGWSRRELCYELLAARMASALDLPIAPYEVLDIPQEILEFSAVPEVDALRAGPAFGSQHVADGASLLPVAVGKVPETLRWQILLFDWWIQNEDRVLGELGGNVNLLWNPDGNELTIIDHNNAFDRDFCETRFFDNHVFRDELERIPAKFLLEQSQTFSTMAALFPQITGDFPDEWMEREENQGDFEPESVVAMLNRSDRMVSAFGGGQNG